MRVTTELIGKTPAGIPVHGFCLTNASGASVSLTNWGARWLAARVPDCNGCLGNVLVTPADPLNDSFYMGATVGRFANRIGGAQIVIDGQMYALDRNDGKHINHGGIVGFDRRLWQWEVLADGVRFTLVSPDGECGFPGTVTASVIYRWDDESRLTICYEGFTDSPTYLNMTNHAYFDLSCQNGKEPMAVYGHELQIPSRYMLDTTPDFIPTGSVICVDGSPFDFTTAKPIGCDMAVDDDQLRWNRGYNHAYLLKTDKSDTMVRAAELYDPESGRRLVVTTDYPCVLLYTAGYYPVPGSAVCLETQYYPDTPSHPSFPSCLLRPGDTYRQTTVFAFGRE